MFLITHFLRNFMWIKDARDRHLNFVFLLLCNSKSCFPLFQEQVRCVFACKFLQK